MVLVEGIRCVLQVGETILTDQVAQGLDAHDYRVSDEGDAQVRQETLDHGKGLRLGGNHEVADARDVAHEVGFNVDGGQDQEEFLHGCSYSRYGRRTRRMSQSRMTIAQSP